MDTPDVDLESNALNSKRTCCTSRLFRPSLRSRALLAPPLLTPSLPSATRFNHARALRTKLHKNDPVSAFTPFNTRLGALHPLCGNVCPLVHT